MFASIFVNKIKIQQEGLDSDVCYPSAVCDDWRVPAEMEFGAF